MSWRTSFVLILSLLSFGGQVQAQEYAIRQFGVDDGLPSSNVYEVKQDNQGFYWIATDQGLVRYDGYEIEQIGQGNSPFNRDIWWSYPDQEGRIWAVGTGNKLWYLENDTLGYRSLSSANQPGVAQLKRMFVDDLETIVFIKNFQLYQIDHNGNQLITRPLVLNESVSDSHPEIFQAKDQKLYLITKGPLAVDRILPGGKFLRIHEYQDAVHVHSQDGSPLTRNEAQTTMVILSQDSIYTITENVLTSYINGSSSVSPFPARSNMVEPSYRVNVLKNRIAFIHSNGTFITDRDFNHLPAYDFISRYNINTIYEDNEGSIWVSTTDQGLIYISKDAIATKTIHPNLELQSAVVSIDIDETGAVWTGYRNGNICRIFRDRTECFRPEPIMSKDSNWMLYQLVCEGGNLVATVGNYELHFFKINDKLTEPDRVKIVKFNIVKSMAKDRTGSINISDYHKSYSIALGKAGPEAPIVVTDYRAFAYTIDASGFELVSTTRGLKRFSPNGDSTEISTNTGIHSFIQGDSHGTFGLNIGRGAALIKGDNSVAIKDLDDLLVRDLYLENDSILWAATNKGLAELHFIHGEFSFKRKLTLAHGLPTLDITAVHVNDTNIFVGTSKGLSVVDRTILLKEGGRSELLLIDVKKSGKQVNIFNDPVLSPSQNSIVFNFVMISPKSNGQITYQFRLKGLEKEWKQTYNRSAEYSFLPPGNYSFELKAFDINGIESSNSLTIPFSVNQFWWKTTWFIVGIIIVWITLSILIYLGRVRSIRKKEEESTEIHKRLADLKLHALRSQMNPHFVFNVLNGIQECFLNDQIREGNRYLSDFSKLMRLFLESSNERTHPLEKEVRILNYYIDLERMRLKNGFDLEFNIAPTIDQREAHIPSMLLQPIIENAILHGLRYKDDKGKLLIEIDQEESGVLNVVIEDNGVGRHRSGQINLQRTKDHNSMAGNIIKERIELLNSSSNDKIEMTIIDLSENGAATGTRVELKLAIELNHE